MNSKEFFIEKDGFKTHAKLDFPCEQRGKYPVLIIVHGFTGHMEETHIKGVAQTAVNNGYAALRIDMYGHGQSDGSFENHTILDWVSQLMWVIDYTLTQDYTQSVSLAGHSQGGLTVMLTAGAKANYIKCLLPLAPATVIVDGCRKGRLLGYETGERPQVIEMGNGRRLKSNYASAAKFLPLESMIKAYDKPVLIVHGTEDEAVPISYAEEANALYKNCTLVKIKGDDHCYTRHLDQVLEAVNNFLAANK